MTPFDERMQALRQRFIGQAVIDADSIERSAASAAWPAVRDLSHGISGRAGMFGFSALSESARVLEAAIENGRRRIGSFC
jgi:HPt (histidine-containing phosphotransfer) domain-containing protein